MQLNIKTNQNRWMSVGQNINGMAFNLNPLYPDSKIKYIKTAVNKYV